MGVPFVFIHAADLHLDSPFKGMAKAPPAVRERLREATFASFRRIVDTALQEGADFVVLAGDLYDMADRSLRAQLRLQRMLATLTEAGIGVYAVHGNHDPESGRKASLDMPDGVHIFGSQEVECVEAKRRDGTLAAHIYGISYGTAAVTDNLALRYVRREGAPFHLALLHANVDGAAGHDNYAPCRLPDLTAAGFDYWALGHVHERRVLHTDPHVVYPGNIQGRSIRESGPRGAYVVRVSSAGDVDMSFRDTADVLWKEAVVTIEGLEREQQLKDKLLAAAEEARRESGGRPVMLRLHLAGRGPLHHALMQPTAAEDWLSELREWLGEPGEYDDWVWPESIVVHTAGMIDAAGLAEDDGFLGELVRRGIAAAADEAESRALLQEATASLRRHPQLREWIDGCSAEERQLLLEQALDLAVLLLMEDDAG